MALTKQDLKEIKNIVSREIESLAVITSNTFEVMERRFENIDKRFENIDKRFENIDKRFDAVDQRFEEIEDRLNYQNQKIDQNHREVMDSLRLIRQTESEDVTALGLDLIKHNKRISKLEKANA